VLAALLWTLLGAVGLYGPTRVIQGLLFPEANPATVIWSPHAGYFWRLLIVAYAGGMLGFVAYVIGERALAPALKALPIAAALLTLQALFVP
jgi:hypothetical protein